MTSGTTFSVSLLKLQCQRQLGCRVWPLGGKGANLFQTTQIGLTAGFPRHHRSLQRLPGRRRKVPQGMWDQELAALKSLEQSRARASAIAVTPC